MINKMEQRLEQRLQQGFNILYDAGLYALENPAFQGALDMIYSGVYVSSGLNANEFKAHWLNYQLKREKIYV